MLSSSRDLNNSPAHTLGVHSRAADGSLRSTRDHRDRQRPGKHGVQLLLASIFLLPIICAFSLFLWFVGIGALIGVSRTEAHSTTAITQSPSPSTTTQLISKQTPISLASLKNKFLDHIRMQKTVSVADFRTDKEIEIEVQPESNFDSAKAKNAALTVAKGWQALSGQPKVSVSIWQGSNMLAKESFP
jgi:hypothetical protein